MNEKKALEIIVSIVWEAQRQYAMKSEMIFTGLIAWQSYSVDNDIIKAIKAVNNSAHINLMFSDHVQEYYRVMIEYIDYNLNAYKRRVLMSKDDFEILKAFVINLPIELIETELDALKN